MLRARPNWLRLLYLTFLAVSCPSSFAGYGGMGGSAEGVGSGVSDGAVEYFFWSVFFGGAVGYFYSRFHNANSEEKIAVDGCIIVGGLMGPFAGLLLLLVR
jgi:hypothetical protein